jgi:hypothetical protein
MEKVTVNKKDLLETLKTNRAEHRKIFEEAIEGYRKTATRLLEEQVTKAKANKRFVTYIQLVQPIDQTKEYDRAIRMIEMSVDQTITLSERDFQQFVMDEWQWTSVFATNSVAYSPTANKKYKDYVDYENNK